MMHIPAFKESGATRVQVTSAASDSAETKAAFEPGSLDLGQITVN